MKKILKKAVLLCFAVCVALTFSACRDTGDTGSSEAVEQHKYNRELYKDGLDGYVKLGEYKNLIVNTADEGFQTEYYEKVIDTDVENYDLYIRQTEGTVADGNTVNIDYVGTMDGVAFDGGTGTDKDLVIGSGSFIDGFEDGLIGAEIGSTVTLNLTFPEDYGNEELNGKAVVFTVTVNYVKSTVGRLPETYFGELGFESLEAYTADVTKRAARDYLLDKVIENAELKYPAEEKAMLLSVLKEQYSQYVTQVYGVDFDTYLSYVGEEESDFEDTMISESVEPMMRDQMVCYAIMDQDDLAVTADEIQAQVDVTAEKYSATEDQIKEYYGDFYFESLAVQEKIVQYIYDHAEITAGSDAAQTDSAAE